MLSPKHPTEKTVIKVRSPTAIFALYTRSFFRRYFRRLFYPMFLATVSPLQRTETLPFGVQTLRIPIKPIEEEEALFRLRPFATTGSGHAG